MSSVSYRGSCGYTTIRDYYSETFGGGLTLAADNTNASCFITDVISYDDFGALILDVKCGSFQGDTVVRASIVDFTNETTSVTGSGIIRGQIELTAPATLNTGASMEGRMEFILGAPQFDMQNITGYIPATKGGINYNNLTDLKGGTCTVFRGSLVSASGRVVFPKNFRIMLQNMDAGGLNTFVVKRALVKAFR